MKQTLFILFLLICINCCLGQKKIKSFSYSDLSFSICIPCLEKDFQKDTGFYSTVLFTPQKVFKRSSTIYDETRIILLDSNTFLCYHIACTARFFSLGDYVRKDNQISLSSNKKLLQNWKDKIDPEILQLAFADFSNKKFLLKDNMLIYQKED